MELISRKAVEKIIKKFFKTKVDEIPKREKFNKLCDLCDLYLELNADLHKEIEGIPAAHELENRASLRDKGVDERYNSYIKSADVYRQATLIMKGAVKDE